MTRFNDTATDTIEYVAEHGVKFTWSDFKVVQTNESVTYEWNPHSKTYMWSGTPTFSYRLDVDKNIRDVVLVNDGTLSDTFIMDDGVHGAVNYTANMASQRFILDVYCPRKDINLIYYGTDSQSYISINGEDYKEYVNLFFYTQYSPNNICNCQEDLILTGEPDDLAIDGFAPYYFSINISSSSNYLLSGMLALKIRPVFDDMTITGTRFRLGEL